MTNYASGLLRLLDERGYIHQLTDAEGLDALAQRQVVPVYIGFDATAPSLHVGSLVQIMMLRRLQQAGHKPIVLMGGGTTRIGDPTGRDESRKMLSDETIEANIASIATVFERLLTFGDGPTDAIMVNNQDWLGKHEQGDGKFIYGVFIPNGRIVDTERVRMKTALRKIVQTLKPATGWGIAGTFSYVSPHDRANDLGAGAAPR